MSIPHLTLLVAIMAIGGGNLVAMKVLVNDLPPFLASSMRFGLALVLLLPFLKIQKGRMKALLLTTMNVGVLNFGLAFMALSMTDLASSMAFIFVLGVPITAILAVVYLGESIGIWRLAGIAGSFAGAVVLGFDPVVFGYMDAMLLGLLVALTFAIGTIQMRRLSGVRPLAFQAWLAATILPFHLAATLLFEEGQIAAMTSMSGSLILALAYTAIMVTMLAHTGYFYLLQRYPVTSVMPFTPLATVFGVGFAVLLLGETLSMQMLVGGLITMAGVLLITLRNRDRALKLTEDKT